MPETLAEQLTSEQENQLDLYESDVESAAVHVIYKKPTFVKCEKMTFPMDIIAKFNGGRFCVQCSGCHGCR